MSNNGGVGKDMNSSSVSLSSQPATGVKGAQDNEKFETTATTVDSGFFSQELSSQDCSGLIDEEDRKAALQNNQQQTQTTTPMRLDSSIDTLQLSKQLFSVHLDSTNDLDKCKNGSKPTTIDSGISSANTQNYFDQDINGDTCLHTAIMEHFLEAARVLIKLAPHQLLLDTLNDEAQSPLHLAVLTGQWKIVRWLIVAGARPGARNLCGDSPLHIAARNGDINSLMAITKSVDRKEIDQLELMYVPKHSTYNLEQWNYEGQTCLHVAALYGHLSVVQHLLDFGANVNAREGKSGYTALHIAVETDNEEIVRYLVTAPKGLNYETYTYGGLSVLQLGHDVDMKLREVLDMHDVPSYISSEDEDNLDSDNEDFNMITVESQF